MEENVRATPSPAPKKRPHPVMRVLLFLLSLALILAAMAAVAFRDSLNIDNIKRWFHYRSLVLSDSGRAESFPYDGTLEDSFTILDGDLLVCSSNTVSLYSGSGTCYVSQSVAMEHPVVDSNGSLAVVYDAGGSDLYVLGQRELIWSTRDLDSILSARLNRSGQLTVVTQAAGYRGQVTVYDSSYQPMMSVNLSSAFVMDAALSDDGKTLSIITVSQQEGVFTTNLSFYSMNTAGSGQFTPDRTCSLDGSVVLDSKHTATALWSLGDLGLNITDHNGRITTVDWSDRYLKRYTLDGEDFAAALLGKYRAGSEAELWVIAADGSYRTLDLNRQVLSISAAGRYLAVLTGDRLDIYLAQSLELYSSLTETGGARSVQLMADGSAILISSDTAAFYVP